MDITPRHLQEKQFHDAFRGYSHEEVDLFLDEVADAFDKVFRENQTFHHQLRQLEEQLTEARGSEDMLKRMLLTAQKTAEDAVEEARGKAQGMVAAAERKAQEVVANAERRAQEIVAEAMTKERELQVSIEGLKRFDAEYRARLQAFIESQLRVLAEGPVGTRAAPTSAAPAKAAPQIPEPSKAAAPDPGAAAESPPGQRPGPERPVPGPVRSSADAPASDPRPSGQPALEPLSPPSRPATSTAAGERVGSAPPPPADPGVVSAGRQDTFIDEEDDEDRSIKELFWGDE